MATQIGTLLIEMSANVARLQADMEQAKGVVNSATNAIKGAAESAQKALVGVGVGMAAAFSVDAVKQGVNSAIASMGDLEKAATKTGTTVEALSGLKSVAKLSGTSLEEVGAGLQKLSKNMDEAANGAEKQRAVFKGLHIEYQDGNGKLRDSGEVMLDVAKALDGMESGTQRAAVAQQLLGKSGANLLPMMLDLADVGELVGKTTTEMAAMADAYEKQLVKLEGRKKAIYMTIAKDLLPVYVDFNDMLLKSGNLMTNANDKAKALSQDNYIQDWARAGATGIALLMDALDAVGRVVMSVGKGLGALTAQAALVLKGDFSGAAAVEAAYQKDRESIWSGFEAGSNYSKLQAEFAKRDAGEKGIKGRNGGTNPDTGKDSSTSEKISEYERLIKAINEKMAVEQLELASTGNLTEGEKMRAKVMADIEGGTLKLTDKQKENLQLQFDRLIALDKEVELKKNVAKWSDDWTKATDTETKSIKAKIEEERKHIANLGLTKEQQDSLAASKLDLEAATKDEYAANLENAAQYAGPLADAYMQAANAAAEQAKQLRELAGLKREAAAKDAAVEQAKKAADAWKSFAADLERGLTDALMRSFEAGDKFGETFVKNLKNLFKTTVLKLAIQGTVNSGLSALGLTGSSGGASLLGGGSNILGGVKDAYGAYNNFSNMSIGNYATQAGNLFGSASTSAWGTGFSLGANGSSSAISAYNAAAGEAFFAGADAAAAEYAAVANSLEAGAAASQGALGSLSTAMPYIAAAIAIYSIATSMGKSGGVKTAAQGLAELTGSGASARGFEAFSLEHNNADISRNAPTWDWNHKMIESLGNSIIKTAKQLGGDASGLGISLGYDTDPSGTAPDSVTGAVWRQGSNNPLFIKGSNYDRGQYADGLAKESQRITVAALKQIDLHDWADSILKTIDPATATIDELSAAMAKISAGAASIDAVDKMLNLMGTSLSEAFGDKNSEKAFAASDAITKLFGSVDALSSSFTSYYQNFYSSAEKTEDAWKGINEVFASLGMAVPKTRSEFRALVDGLDKTSASYPATLKGLMDVQAAFAALVPSIDDVANASKAAADKNTAAAKAIADAARLAAEQAARDSASGILGLAMSDLANAKAAELAQARADVEVRRAAITEQISAQNALISAFRSAVSSIKKFRDDLSLSAYSPLDPAAQYAEAQRRFDSTAALAQLGNVTALADLPNAAKALLDASKGFNASGDQYVSDYNKVIDALDKSQQVAARGEGNAAARVDALNADLSSLMGTLNASVGTGNQTLLSINSAISNLASAVLTAVKAGVPVTADVAAAAKAAGITEQVKQTANGPLYISNGGAVGYVDANGTAMIKGLVDTASLDDVKKAGLAAYAAGDAKAIYDSALKNGVSLKSLNFIFGQPDGTAEKWAADNGLPTFATGGSYMGGIALVGENGPEIINFDAPGQIYNSAQTRQIIQGDNSDVVAALAESAASNTAGQREIVARLALLDRRMAAMEQNSSLARAA